MEIRAGYEELGKPVGNLRNRAEIMAARTMVVAVGTYENCVGDGTLGYGEGKKGRAEQGRLTWSGCPSSQGYVSRHLSSFPHGVTTVLTISVNRPLPGAACQYINGVLFYKNYSFYSLCSVRELWSLLL